ncbi:MULTISPECIES: PD-(D/E)XK nuclease-like domain-containing protein [unclassified Cupriavidus]|uniref:PD-(D/E)XK nuclease-like domain-containing protein n=1 Tax=unclassified Cupriavidus TaxID=2640874 RepID=UPI001C007ABC|nr:MULTISPECIES: PD-(D/E)XK nuclease-like domain-containing protein [unclassified Cupriavidus]MCA3188303.1 PD-(D/E)XK nuclease-like domain-containing protein [Cupriavidus sp.]MCA3189843.1 PD-(D/E)XK nuclease-like domain-containing protein [Cupriavidus sp.]MCA3196437.1 PD-(D/E)XK nuclease-like domain-containing protein [Cupriavidus sp.]MCA3202182.1 PD-(D/E)XK nuclease-like domain-containing protein [Cupriavidus sp.]QWE93321.1 PD-(D/E)XK nuclease-like domain-containing protein [Cupriavidus sp. E
MNAPRSITELWTGVQHGLSIDAYHGMEGASKTVLDSVSKSPAIAYARHLDPNRPAAEQKSGQLEGELAHCAILEPDQFDVRYVVGPDWNRNTNKWKDYVAEMAAARPGVTILKPEQRETAMRQGESVRRLPEIRDALAAGHPEVSAFWIDPETGVKCRCRPDWVHPCGEAGAILLDVKTYSDASPAEFRRQVARKRYHVQDAFYSDGFARASALEVLAFVFVAVETEYPCAANALMLDDLAKTTGRDLYRYDLNTYGECLRTGEWPGYSDQIQIINLPNWALID